jgi:dimethylargininase
METLSRALVRPPSPAYVAYYAARGISISAELAREQHAGYVAMLEAAGLQVRTIEPDAAFPDCVFIEDTAVVWGDRALITRMAPHREGEQAAVEAALRATHEIVRLPTGATLDGGDVLHVGPTTYVGLSSRTNAAGVQAVANLLTPFGRPVVPVPVSRCLHLKSAVTALAADTILAGPGMINVELFRDCKIILTDERETHAANCLRVRDHVLVLGGYPETIRRVPAFADANGLRVVALPMSEFEKGDGSLTCLSILW